MKGHLNGTHFAKVLPHSECLKLWKTEAEIKHGKKNVSDVKLTEKIMHD